VELRRTPTTATVMLVEVLVTTVLRGAPTVADLRRTVRQVESGSSAVRRQ
jgi:hypothetical protein